MQKLCRYDDKCDNGYCRFKHNEETRKDCGFGATCNKETCTFKHPPDRVAVEDARKSDGNAANAETVEDPATPDKECAPAANEQPATKTSNPKGNTGKSKKKRLFQITFFAFFPSGYSAAIAKLSEKAKQENWGEQNCILENYIDHVYRFIRKCHTAKDQEDRGLIFSKDGQNAVLHTSLYTSEYTPIFARFQKNNVKNRQEWCFLAWLDQYNLQRANVLQDEPKPIRWVSHHYELYYNPEIILYPDIKHIMQGDENHGRVQKLLPGQNHDMHVKLLTGAIEQMKVRVQQNSRTVVPQYYARNNCIQLLLPLNLTGGDTIDLVLTCQRVKRPEVTNADPNEPSHWRYEASTVLELPMAYANARVLNRIESEWLHPPLTPDAEVSDTESTTNDG